MSALASRVSLQRPHVWLRRVSQLRVPFQAGRGYRPGATRVQILETSLGLGVDSKLLRHLGLRFGAETDELKVENGNFKEAHFGPGSGQLQEGFLNCGDGMVAASEYMELNEAGYTDKSVEECIKWCENWADGRLFMTVGQNCWSMVNDFVEDDKDLTLPESVRFKEKQVNGWTELFVNAAQEKADKDGVEIGEVWEEVMQNPRKLIPELFDNIKPDSLSDLVPDSVEQAAENASQAKDAAVTSVKSSVDQEGFLNRAAEQVGSKFEDIKKEFGESAEEVAKRIEDK